MFRLSRHPSFDDCYAFLFHPFPIMFHHNLFRNAAIGFLLWFFSCVGLDAQINEPVIGNAQQEFAITPQGENALDGCPIWMQVTVEERQHRFVLDTGSGVNVMETQILPKTTQELGKTRLRTASGESFESKLYGPIEVEIPSGDLTLDEVVLRDLSDFSSIVGVDVSGIVGSPFIIDHGLRYDHSARSFSVCKSPSNFVSKPYAIRVSDSLELLTSDVVVGNVRGEFVIDTGLNTPICLARRYFNRIVENGVINNVQEARNWTISGSETVRCGIAKVVTAWGHEFSDVPVIESNRNRVGLRLLQRFDFQIFGSANRIVVCKHKDTDTPFMPDRSGISLVVTQNAFVIDAIKNGFPASKCGLSRGDEIIEVDSCPVELGWIGLHKIRTMFAAPGPARYLLLVKNSMGLRDVVIEWK